MQLQLVSHSNVCGCRRQQQQEQERDNGIAVAFFRRLLHIVPMMMVTVILMQGSVVDAFVALPASPFGCRVHHRTVHQALTTTSHHPFRMGSNPKQLRSSSSSSSSLLFMTKSGMTQQQEDKVLLSKEPRSPPLPEPVTTSSSSAASATTTIRPFVFPLLFFDDKNNKVDQASYNGNIKGASTVDRAIDSIRVSLDKANNVKVDDSDDDSSSDLLLFPSSTSGILSFLLNPIAQALQSATDGWALTYANLFPETESTLGGRIFLATNLAYVLAGVGLWAGFSVVSPSDDNVMMTTMMMTSTASNPWPLSVGLEVASICSFAYHYQQLKNDQPSLVRLALMVDYIAAAVTIVLGGVYVLQDVFLMMNAAGMTSASLDEYTTWLQMTVASALLSGACLSVSWVWERGLPYLLFHSLWHLTSAYTGYAVGMMHVAAMVAASSSSNGDSGGSMASLMSSSSVDVINCNLAELLSTVTTLAVAATSQGG